MLKIAIIDADLVSSKKPHFPNLACMKISSWHKNQEHDVGLLLDYSDDLSKYDKVYISKVFTDTEIEQSILELSNVEYGGTGFFYDKAPPLPKEIEHSKPDYDLYSQYVSHELEKGVNPKKLEYYTDYSIGFTTRGCIRQCSFCVNKNYKTCELHSPIEEFLDENRKCICLLDDNVLACKNWKYIFEELSKTKKAFQFKQGMDERLLTKEKCEIIFKLKWIGDYIFAFDNIKDKSVIEEKLKIIRSVTNRNIKFYLFCAYNHNDEIKDNQFWANDISDLFERIRILMKYKAYSYVMRYEDYQNSPYRGMYINIASWCNQPHMYKKKSFREFCLADQARYKGDNIISTLRYMQEFEKDYPDIAKKYFDMKLEDLSVC